MRVAIAVSALTLLSMGAANAAVASLDFEGSTELSVSPVSFGGVLAQLGIVGSTLANTNGGVQGVWTNLDQDPRPDLFGHKSFTIGYNGTWTIDFGGLGIDMISMIYYDSEVFGFTSSVFGLDDTTVLQTKVINGGPGLQGFGILSFSGLGPIGKFTITDLWDNAHFGGDNVMLDNLTVNVITPEPSTYLMIGSALAGLAALRRRRA